MIYNSYLSYAKDLSWLDACLPLCMTAFESLSSKKQLTVLGKTCILHPVHQLMHPCWHCTAMLPLFWKYNYVRWEMQMRHLLHLPCHSFTIPRSASVYLFFSSVRLSSPRARHRGTRERKTWLDCFWIVCSGWRWDRECCFLWQTFDGLGSCVRSWCEPICICICMCKMVCEPIFAWKDKCQKALPWVIEFLQMRQVIHERESQTCRMEIRECDGFNW